MIGMQPREIVERLGETVAAVPQSGLLMLAVGAMIVGWLGTMLARRRIVFGRVLGRLSSVVLAGVLLTVVLQIARFDSRLDVALPEFGLPRQQVSGGETRIPLAHDGHFWLEAKVDGIPTRFLVDTGATLTAVSSETARAAGLSPRRSGIPVQIRTANGAIAAELTTIETLRFGNIEASGLDAVIAPNLGRTNVLGMNFLSRLAGWRVERNILILTPDKAMSEN